MVVVVNVMLTENLVDDPVHAAQAASHGRIQEHRTKKVTKINDKARCPLVIHSGALGLLFGPNLPRCGNNATIYFDLNTISRALLKG